MEINNELFNFLWLTILSALKIIAIFIFVVVIHECGHYAIAKRFGKFPKFVWYNRNPAIRCNRTNKKEFLYITLAGIIVGYLALMLIFQFYNVNFISKIMIVLAYTYGCRYEIAQIIKLELR